MEEQETISRAKLSKQIKVSDWLLERRLAIRAVIVIVIVTVTVVVAFTPPTGSAVAFPVLLVLVLILVLAIRAGISASLTHPKQFLQLQIAQVVAQVVIREEARVEDEFWIVIVVWYQELAPTRHQTVDWRGEASEMSALIIYLCPTHTISPLFMA